MIDKAYRLIIYFFFFLFPLYYLPLGNLNTELDKQTLLIFTTLLLLLLFTIKVLITKKITLIRTPADYILLLLCLVFLLSTIIYAPNKIESLAKPLGTGAIIFVFLLFFLLNQTKKLSILPLIISLILTALYTLYQLITLKTFVLPPILPVSFAWPILMEGYKNFGNFLLGVGPSNYQYIFMLGKPAAFNETSFWNLIFTSSSTYFLTLASEVGILGVGLFLYLVVKILKSTISKPYLILLIITLLIQLLLPGNILLLTLTFILFAYVLPKHETKKISVTRVLPISLIGLISLIFFLQSRYYLSDISFRLAQQSLNNNSLNDAEFYTEKSLSFNPLSDRTHLLSGALNFTKASLLGPGATDSATLTKQVEYFQNSITHTKKAIDLNPQNSQYYGQLAQIYESLIGKVSDSQKWALDSYNRQIMLEPNSPQPKLAAANLLMKLSQDQYSFNLIIQAISLKPDWNNAHYNLAILLSRAGRLIEAKEELQKTLVLTGSNTNDYQKVQEEINKLDGIINQQASQSAEATPAAKNKK